MALLIAITSNAIRYQKTSIWNLWNNEAPTLAKSWKKHQIERLKIHKIMENDNLEVKSIIARQKHSGGCPVSLAELSRGSSSSCPCSLPWASSCTPLHIPWTERASLWSPRGPWEVCWWRRGRACWFSWASPARDRIMTDELIYRNRERGIKLVIHDKKNIYILCV